MSFDENPYNSCNAYVTFAQRYVTFRTHISMVELNEDGGLEIMGEEMVARTFPKQWNEALTAIHAIRVRRTDRGTA